MRRIKTADGNEFVIKNGIVSDARGQVHEGFLSKIPKVKIGDSMKLHYYQKDDAGELIRDFSGNPETRVVVTPPVVFG